MRSAPRRAAGCRPRRAGPGGPGAAGRRARRGDVTHEITRRLNSTFLTPFDRQDIYALAAIVGVGATRRMSAVRWGVAGSILAAWVLTIPAAGALAAGTYLVARPLLG